MKISTKCYLCIYCRQCDINQEMKCREMDYALFTTEADKEMCDLMGCGNEDEVEEN